MDIKASKNDRNFKASFSIARDPQTLKNDTRWLIFEKMCVVYYFHPVKTCGAIFGRGTLVAPYGSVIFRLFFG